MASEAAEKIAAMHNAGIGHNSAPGVAKDKLASFVERVEHLEAEKKSYAEDIRDVLKEAKSSGFDVKAIRSIIRIKKQDAAKRKEEEAILETYMHALGMLD